LASGNLTASLAAAIRLRSNFLVILGLALREDPKMDSTLERGPNSANGGK